MNTQNLNARSENLTTEEYVSAPKTQPRISSQVSIEAPSKKNAKAQGAFRTISEVATKLDVQQHVLRFWETKFSQIRPLKRGGGRRYYRPEDVALLQRIHHLLYTEGYTIKGVQKLLKGQGKAQIIAEANQANNQNAQAIAPSPKVAPPAIQQAQISVPSPKTPVMSVQQRTALEIMLAELKAMRAMIKA